MIYVTSDLHGIGVDVLTTLLERVGFGDDDFLFILGDVIDRGEHSVELLQWIMLQSNVQMLLGNHEAMLLSCKFIFDEITDDSIEGLGYAEIGTLSTWLSNGGDKTLSDLKALNDTSPEEVGDIIDFLSDLPLYETVSAGGQDFLLVHSGLGGFRDDKRMREYTPDELLWCRPSLDDVYFDDIITVFGHTPTIYYGEQYGGRIIRTKSWINVDTGASGNFTPSLLRLDDLKEFYI